MIQIRMSLRGKVKVFENLKFISIIHRKEACLRNLQRIYFSMERSFIKDFKHSRIPYLNVVWCCYHVHFIKAYICNRRTYEYFNSWNSISGCPPLNDSFWTSQSYNSIGSVLSHDCVRIFSNMISNILSCGGIIIFKFPLIIWSE